jgi:hypothetical protein
MKALALAIGLAAAAPSAAFAANFEVVYVPGTPQVSFTVFRIEVATGQVLSGAAGTPNYTAISDSPALPPGDYHLYLADILPPIPAGAIDWGLIRMDGKTGRTWSLTGGGPAPFKWIEMVAPQ